MTNRSSTSARCSRTNKFCITFLALGVVTLFVLLVELYVDDAESNFTFLRTKPSSAACQVVDKARSPKQDLVIPTKQDDLVVDYLDMIYLADDWDESPVVMEEYKLLFFTVPKVGCTAFKQLFRRMMGYSNWNVENTQMLPWNPQTNGLKYLYHYNRTQASHMMTSPDWTRAIFVREPKARFLSAWLDKVVSNPSYFSEKCCYYSTDRGACLEKAKSGPAGFLDLIYFCDNAHWNPFSRRMESKYWKYINFVGHLETVDVDAKRLLTHLGAWQTYGSSGWGENGQGAFMQPDISNGRHHATNAKEKLKEYLKTPALVKRVEDFYANDYLNPVLNLTRIVLD